MAKTLHCGDNLDVLEGMTAETVDLVYLDPPFNSSAIYNVIHKDHNTGASQAQNLAFVDTWRWGDETVKALRKLEQRRGDVAMVVDLLVQTLGKSSRTAYLCMMGARLVELHRVLKPTGSLYLHCDPAASHYLKVVLDIIFGPKRFKNEIIWKRQSGHNDAKRGFADVTDTILFYGKSERVPFNVVRTPLDPSYVEKFYRHRDENGRLYRLSDMAAPAGGGMAAINKATGKPNGWYMWQGYEPPERGWRYSPDTMQRLHDETRIHYPKDKTKRLALKRYLDENEGAPVPNLWDDIAPVQAQAQERLGYPTQKPLALLERIILASSKPGDVVLDPFCGCGTAVSAAQKLGREWIGVDIAHLAVSEIQRRLRRDHQLEPGKHYTLEGTPKDVETARFLFEKTQDGPYQFQFWALGVIGAQPYGVGSSGKGKKGADTGIDGKLYFRTPRGEKLETVIVSVKGGKNLSPSMVRDLKGTVARERAAMGVFITLEEPTDKMRQEAVGETYSYGSEDYPKIQLLTVQDILDGKRPKVPYGAANVSFDAKPVQTDETVAKRRSLTPLFSEDELGVAS